MPYKSEKIKIEHTQYDRRVKLTPKQREAVMVLRNNGYSYNEIAEVVGCAKSTIQYIIRPFKRSEPKKHSREYYTQKKREYRRRKQQLYVDGKIK